MFSRSQSSRCCTWGTCVVLPVDGCWEKRPEQGNKMWTSHHFWGKLPELQACFSNIKYTVTYKLDRMTAKFAIKSVKSEKFQHWFKPKQVNKLVTRSCKLIYEAVAARTAVSPILRRQPFWTLTSYSSSRRSRIGAEAEEEKQRQEKRSRDRRGEAEAGEEDGF